MDNIIRKLLDDNFNFVIIDGMNNYTDTGHHLIGKISGVKDVKKLNNAQFIVSVLKKIAREADLTVLKSDFHKFKPQGVSAYIMISESHLAFHSYPEARSAFIDIFSCKAQPPTILEKSFFKICRLFGAKNCNYTILFR